MRISDWSSDVCSSDLVADIASELDTDDAVAIIEDLDADDQREVLRAMEPDDRAAIEEALSYPEESAGRLMQRELIAVPEHWRSEEHTSELQSLMRISYAVVCLKKKIKQAE